MVEVTERLVAAPRSGTQSRDARSATHAIRNTVAVVLAGGRGSRLKQLTEHRAKPSVAFGGKFRIIDFTLSNCINSGIRRIGICTQYKSHSLIRHVQRGWSFLDGRFDEFVEVMPAQQRTDGGWYQGTADAVFQNLDIIRRQDPQLVLVVAGDHVYKMDYRRMIEEHVLRGAKLTVACTEAPVADAAALGVVRTDWRGRITAFQEKPESDPYTVPGHPDKIFASMGIYIFDAAFLYAQLGSDAQLAGSGHDFGKDIIPKLVREHGEVYAHDFHGSCVNMTDGKPYWRDVGTVDAFWEANMDLTKVVPELNLYDKAWPIWTHQEQIPPAKFVFDDPDRRGCAVDSIVAGGCIVSGSTVKRSLLFTNVRVHNHCRIEDSVILSGAEIGPDAVLRNAIVDKHCRIPSGVRIGIDLEEDRKHFHVTERGRVLVTPEMLGQAL
ncbi:MAG: glucose-1-phosphate adenylyltransferase [Pseudomonadota bacterium]|nr:glucose-1-phosphate adenylyltransferase [Pseudomonadota bacterium]